MINMSSSVKCTIKKAQGIRKAYLECGVPVTNNKRTDRENVEAELVMRGAEWQLLTVQNHLFSAAMQARKDAQTATPILSAGLTAFADTIEKIIADL